MGSRGKANLSTCNWVLEQPLSLHESQKGIQRTYDTQPQLTHTHRALSHTHFVQRHTHTSHTHTDTSLTHHYMHTSGTHTDDIDVHTLMLLVYTLQALVTCISVKNNPFLMKFICVCLSINKFLSVGN